MAFSRVLGSAVVRSSRFLRLARLPSPHARLPVPRALSLWPSPIRLFAVDSGTGQPWLTGQLPQGYWADLKNQKKFFDWLGKELGYTKPEDWYQLKKSDVTERGGSSLLVAHHRGSLVNALKAVYPDVQWQEWNFSSLTPDFWENKANTKRYFEWLKNKLGFKTNDDWYNLRQQDITTKGRGPLAVYDNSIAKTLKAIYPDVDWQEWRFGKIPRNFWEDKTNQRKFLEDVGKTLGVKSLDDWFSVKEADLKSRGGTGLLERHMDSLPQTLKALYPEHDWSGFEYLKAPQGFWNTDKNVKEFITFLGKKLGINADEEWYKITHERVIHFGGGGLLTKFGNMYEPLAMTFPTVEWNSAIFEEKSRQDILRWLKLSVQELFPTAKLDEATKIQGVKYDGQPFQADLYLPTLKIAFILRGESHYRDVSEGGTVSHEQRRQRDEELRDSLSREGVTLIQIPHWWLGDLASLCATVHEAAPKHFPAVRVPPKAKPIPQEPPSYNRRRGGTRAARLPKNYLLKAREYSEHSINPTGYWMSEKLDGLRAFWDGTRLFSKNGNEIFAPEWFIRMLPAKIALDGEIWGGKGQFEFTCTTVIRRRDQTDPLWEENWKKIQFHIFDAPEAKGGFEERLKYGKQVVEEWRKKGSDILHVIQMYKVESVEHMQRFLREVADRGGEGVMLREANCEYKHGRSKTLLKVKPHREDEVRYIERNEEGKSLLCEARSGEKLLVKCSLFDYENPPEVGAVITVRHSGHHASGKPKFPYFLRVRKDTTWQDILEEEQ